MPQPADESRLLVNDKDFLNAGYVTGELKDCPFCGKKPISYGRKNEKTGNIVYTVACPGLECTANTFCCQATAEHARSSAIAKWNNRPAPPESSLKENQIVMTRNSLDLLWASAYYAGATDQRKHLGLQYTDGLPDQKTQIDSLFNKK